MTSSSAHNVSFDLFSKPLTPCGTESLNTFIRKIPRFPPISSAACESDLNLVIFFLYSENESHISLGTRGKGVERSSRQPSVPLQIENHMTMARSWDVTQMGLRSRSAVRGRLRGHAAARFELDKRLLIYCGNAETEGVWL